jgi:hypothetical protein
LQREDTVELEAHVANSLVDHGRNSDLSDIQEEEEEEEEEELEEEEEEEEEEELELGSRTCSFQKQVAGNSIRENGAKVMGWEGADGPQTSCFRGLHPMSAATPATSSASNILGVWPGPCLK